MKVIVKPINIKNLDEYIKMGAKAFFFGVKNLCVDITNQININDLKKNKKKGILNIEIFLSKIRNIFNRDLVKLKSFDRY